MSIKIIKPSISIEKLSFKNILSNINYTINRGEYLAIIGPNGGGKSTLLRVILGLEKPSSGKVVIHSQSIGYVPQRAIDFDSNFPATVYEVVKMALEHIQKDKIDILLSELNILNLKNRLIGTLSGGQKQRVMIARAMITNPDILVLDEPNTGVDQQTQKSFYAYLKKLNTNGTTIIFVTHDIGVIADDIKSVLSINKTNLSCHNPSHMLSCDSLSDLYGIKSHSLYSHHGSNCGLGACSV